MYSLCQSLCTVSFMTHQTQASPRQSISPSSRRYRQTLLTQKSARESHTRTFSLCPCSSIQSGFNDPRSLTSFILNRTSEDFVSVKSMLSITVTTSALTAGASALISAATSARYVYTSSTLSSLSRISTAPSSAKLKLTVYLSQSTSSCRCHSLHGVSCRLCKA